MIIIKLNSLKKLKQNKYELSFDNSSVISLYDDIIVKYRLIVGKLIEQKELEVIIKENDALASYYIALKYSNTKLRSEKEIRNYLAKKEFNEDNISNTIDKLKKDNILNTKVYIEAFINDQINLSNNGYYKILQKLIALGFKETEIINYLDSIESSLWNERCEKLIDKKIKLNHKYSGYRLKEKIAYDLINLGYKKEMIIDILDNNNIKDNNLLIKEYEKLKKKLEKKYEGKELYYQIKNKLYQKGFNIDDINSIIE